MCLDQVNRKETETSWYSASYLISFRSIMSVDPHTVYQMVTNSSIAVVFFELLLNSKATLDEIALNLPH